MVRLVGARGSAVVTGSVSCAVFVAVSRTQSVVVCFLLAAVASVAQGVERRDAIRPHKPVRPRFRVRMPL